MSIPEEQQQPEPHERRMRVFRADAVEKPRSQPAVSVAPGDEIPDAKLIQPAKQFFGLLNDPLDQSHNEAQRRTQYMGREFLYARKAGQAFRVSGAHLMRRAVTELEAQAAQTEPGSMASEAMIDLVGRQAGQAVEEELAYEQSFVDLTLTRLQRRWS